MTRAQLVFGLGFVTLGTLLLLDRADLLDAWAIVSAWWPTVVILAGLTQLVMRPRNVASGAFVSLMGLALLLWSLRGIDTVAVLWPLVLVGVGLWLLTRRPSGERTAHVVTDPDLLALFDDRVVRVPSGALDERSVTTIFGDLDLDLRDATLTGAVRLQVVTIFGDVDLLVPEGWEVTVSGPEIFGSVRVDPVSGVTAGSGELRLEVVTIFGDVAVRRTAADRGLQDR